MAPLNHIVIRVAVSKPIDTVFDYEVPQHIPCPNPGVRVRVPFGRSETIGLCLGVSKKTAIKDLKSILEIIDDRPLFSKTELEMRSWLSSYYHYPFGETLFSTIPSEIKKGKPLSLNESEYWIASPENPPSKRAQKQRVLYDFIRDRQGASSKEIKDSGFSTNIFRTLRNGKMIRSAEPPNPGTHEKNRHQLNQEQQSAFEKFRSSKESYKCYLLEGITGSGKTEVYLQAMESIVAAGKEVLVLVPEISLTPQTFQRFSARFPRTGLIHSGLSSHNILQTWLKCREGKITCLVGTRSAVFAPLQNLGLIIVDEEHDSSYKQQEGLKYSARDVAVKRANQLNIPIILGSATPSIESINNVDRGKYSLLSLKKRANDLPLPVQQIVDMASQKMTGGFALKTIDTIKKHLTNGNQVMVFINKRGFSRTQFCTNCGWRASCVRCETKTTKHINPDRMVCHYCGWQEKVRTQCPECRQEKLIALGLGTQKLESSLINLFPEFPVYRIDRDSARNAKQFENLLEQINSEQPCLLVGTQMLSKGHDFRNLTLVVIMEADAGFNAIDFRGPEKTAQQIVQVSGRSGRHRQTGEILFQSYQTSNSALVDLLENGYKNFAQNELKIREKMKFPPFSSMAIIRAEALNPKAPNDLLKSINQRLTEYQTLGPAPAIIRKVLNRYRYQLMVLCSSKHNLDKALFVVKEFMNKNRQRGVRLSIDVDPIEI